MQEAADRGDIARGDGSVKVVGQLLEPGLVWRGGEGDGSGEKGEADEDEAFHGKAAGPARTVRVDRLDGERMLRRQKNASPRGTDCGSSVGFYKNP